MDRFHWLFPISTETIFTLVCLGVILLLWLAWMIISSTSLADKWHTIQWEEWLWRKHGVSINGLFFSTLVIILILYGVWTFLGEL